MTSSLPLPASMARRCALLLLLAYPLLTIAGAVTHRPGFALAALWALLTAVLLPHLLARRAAPWLLWLGLQAALLSLWSYGWAGLLQEAVPVLINALLACWFGCTLATAEPRIASIIVAIEGEQRLAQPGVARYARRLTWFWTLLLGAHALLLAVLLVCAEPGGLLARLGVASPLPIPGRWAAAWLHVGGYVLLALAFVLEYGYRRWRLRHLSHAGLRQMLLQLARHWPQLLRGKSGAAP